MRLLLYLAKTLYIRLLEKWLSITEDAPNSLLTKEVMLQPIAAILGENMTKDY